MASLPPQASLAAWLAQEEELRQQNVVDARLYYAGHQQAMLTQRQKEFLGFTLRRGRFAFNYCATVVDAVTERLIVESFVTENTELAKAIAKWWKDNRMDQRQQDVHDGAVEVGEHFVIVDWNDDESRPRFSPHPRFTGDSIEGGTGFGCKAHYPDDDPEAPMLFASKRWTGMVEENGRERPRQMMTLYFPERVERYVMAGDGEATWQLLTIQDEDGPLPSPLPWTMSGEVGGDPIGIPVIHFRNPGVRSELWDAIPPQDLINKTALDIIAAADAAGFPMIAAKGFNPTTDGKDPASDGSNAIKLSPGVWIPIPPEGDIDVIQAANLTPMLATLDSYIIKLAQITSTPLSRFQLSGNTPRAETLKQQEGPLLSKVGKRQTRFGNSWEDCQTMATRIAVANREPHDLEARVETKWKTAETQDKLEEEKKLWDAAKVAGEAGVPLLAFLELQGWPQERIDIVIKDPTFQAKAAMLNAVVEGRGG